MCVFHQLVDPSKYNWHYKRRHLSTNENYLWVFLICKDFGLGNWLSLLRSIFCLHFIIIFCFHTTGSCKGYYFEKGWGYSFSVGYFLPRLIRFWLTNSSININNIFQANLIKCQKLIYKKLCYFSIFCHKLLITSFEALSICFHR